MNPGHPLTISFAMDTGLQAKDSPASGYRGQGKTESKQT